MSDRLILIMGHSPSDPVVWGRATGPVINELGRLKTSHDVGAIIDQLDQDVSIAVILPGEQVAIRSLPNPPRNNAKLISASKYLLEDDLGEDADAIHISVTTIDDIGRIYAITKSQFEEWLSALQDCGIDPDFISSDFACLEATSAHPMVIQRHDRIIASAGERGFAADETLASFVMPALGVEASPEFSAIGDQKTLFEITRRRPTKKGRYNDAVFLKLIAQSIDNETAVNFRQGEFKRRQKIFTGAENWRPSAILAVSVMVCALALVAANGFRDKRIADRYNLATVSLYQKAFPEIARNDIRRHAGNIVSSQSTGASFLRLSQLIATVVDGNEGLAIERIRYDASRGNFVMAIRSQSDTDIEVFRNSLANAGVIAEDNGGYRRSGSTLIGEMTARMK